MDDQAGNHQREGQGQQGELQGQGHGEGEMEGKEKKTTAAKIIDILNNSAVQFVFYMLFLISFQSLTESIRVYEEFYFDKHFTDTFLENTFDDHHNTFYTIRRWSDFYQWCNNVLLPGLFSNQDVGENWPDGDGSFFLEGATPYSVEDMRQLYNVMDFTAGGGGGVMFRQVRTASSGVCPGQSKCYPDWVKGEKAASNVQDKQSYGYGDVKFHWSSTEDTGGAPSGMHSASIISERSYPSDGFVSVFMPFFSEAYLPPENGTLTSITDFRDTISTHANGKKANYYCIRTSINGVDARQVCNPESSTNGGVVRNEVSSMIRQMKSAHYIDFQTRCIAIIIQLVNQNIGLRFRVQLMFEMTAEGAILPSFDIETKLDNPEQIGKTKLWMVCSLIIMLWFMMLEAAEIANSEFLSYVCDFWNCMDWLNFVNYGLVFLYLVQMLSLDSKDFTNCTSKLCKEFGYFDCWEVTRAARAAKFNISICITISLLKIVKFTNTLVPKMSLMSKVLSVAFLDLFFFSVVFAISLFAFCMMFYVQLGSFMDDFYSHKSAVIALIRALFGDFDFEEILDNSRGYLNGILFLTYLFVAVFILLSMFLAILGEAQAKVREREKVAQAAGELLDPYGIISVMYHAWLDRMNQVKEATGLPDLPLAMPPTGKGPEGAGSQEGPGTGQGKLASKVQGKLTELRAAAAQQPMPWAQLESWLLELVDQIQVQMDKAVIQYVTKMSDSLSKGVAERFAALEAKLLFGGASAAGDPQRRRSRRGSGMDGEGEGEGEGRRESADWENGPSGASVAEPSQLRKSLQAASLHASAALKLASPTREQHRGNAARRRRMSSPRQSQSAWPGD